MKPKNDYLLNIASGSLSGLSTLIFGYPLE